MTHDASISDFSIPLPRSENFRIDPSEAEILRCKNESLGPLVVSLGSAGIVSAEVSHVHPFSDGTGHILVGELLTDEGEVRPVKASFYKRSLVARLMHLGVHVNLQELPAPVDHSEGNKAKFVTLVATMAVATITSTLFFCNQTLRQPCSFLFRNVAMATLCHKKTTILLTNCAFGYEQGTSNGC